jgi:hypothetical protein
LILDVEKYPINIILKTKAAIKNVTIGIINPTVKTIWVLVNGFPVVDKKRNFRNCNQFY